MEPPDLPLPPLPTKAEHGHGKHERYVDDRLLGGMAGGTSCAGRDET